MRLLIVALSFIALSWAGDDPSPTLKDAVAEYQKMQSELDQILKSKTRDCTTEIGNANKIELCSLASFCKLSNRDPDSPISYQNSEGKKIVNLRYYQDRELIKACLAESFTNEIDEKRDELTTTLKTDHLKKIIAANNKLSNLIKTNGQAVSVQKVSSEILNLSMEAGINQKDATWESAQASKTDLMSLLTVAEQRQKVKLNSEIKKTLVEIQYLKLNQSYLSEVDKVENAMLPQIKINNPLYDFSQLTDEAAAGGHAALMANQEMLKQKSQAAYDIFKSTQAEMIAFLESQKNESNLTMMERAIDRVKTITFKPPRITPSMKKICTFPQAFYDGDDHSFAVCPQFLDFPVATIKETMAHEIAHSFDSCNLSGQKLAHRGPIVVEEAPFEIDLGVPPTSPSTIKLNWDESDKQIKRPTSKTVVQEKMLYVDHPFIKRLSCLQTPNSVGAKAINPAEINLKIKAELKSLADRGEDGLNNGKARYLKYFDQHQNDFLNFFQGCDLNGAGVTLGRSQLQEAFADNMAAEIIGQNINKMSTTDAQKAVLEIILGNEDVCTNESSGEEKLRDFAKRYGCQNYFENKSHEQVMLQALKIIDPPLDPHPATADRIDKILLANPAILKALNCPVKQGVKNCE